jgi:phosphoglycolate phosphatase-like HAD superfamily hydrolase
MKSNSIRFRNTARGAWRVSFLSLLMLTIAALNFAQSNPLPSWNDGATKNSILNFVARVTKPGGPEFVPVEQRIATFDNDGTLWVEQPMYVQLAFAFARVKELSPQHPEWKTTQPFQGVLEGNVKDVAASGEKGLMELMAATHAGMSTDEFERIVTNWLATARHPKLNRLYTECVYEPMLELMNYLRANGFKTYIVSGGGVEFMRPMTQRIYGIPLEQVIGSAIKTKFELQGDQAVLMRLPGVDFIDDKEGKPIAINRGLWEFGWRSTNAGMDGIGLGRALDVARASRRCSARVCLRPKIFNGSARQSARRSNEQRMDCGEYERRLEDDIPTGALK